MLIMTRFSALKKKKLHFLFNVVKLIPQWPNFTVLSQTHVSKKKKNNNTICKILLIDYVAGIGKALYNLMRVKKQFISVGWDILGVRVGVSDNVPRSDTFKSMCLYRDY